MIFGDPGAGEFVARQDGKSQTFAWGRLRGRFISASWLIQTPDCTLSRLLNLRPLHGAFAWLFHQRQFAHSNGRCCAATTTRSVVPLAQGDLGDPWSPRCPVVTGYLEVDRVHGLAGGPKITRAGGGSPGPGAPAPRPQSHRSSLLERARARPPGDHSTTCAQALACPKLAVAIKRRLFRVFNGMRRCRAGDLAGTLPIATSVVAASWPYVSSPLHHVSWRSREQC